MKIDKQLRKEYVKRIQQKAKESGYKAPQYMFYKIQEDDLLYGFFTFVSSGELVYHLEAKKMSFDNIFWKIMDMEDNMKRSNTLRVNGAFVSPGVSISNGKIPLTEDIDGISNDFIDKATNDFAVFCENNDIIDYIFSGKQVPGLKTLKCLAYIDSGQESKAVELATKQIEKGDTGRFVSANKGFFERVVIKYA